MKKIALFLLSVCLCLISFSGCSEKPETNVWDGTVAKSFAKGDGSEKSPFIIKKASQLAYLASEINSGKDYTGKYISLACDLDLNHLEWTPIGNGTYLFSGVFDGNDHIISNLKITNGMHFIGEISTAELSQYTTGLFGCALDAVIHNMKIDQADITIQNTVDRQFIAAGVLVGDIRANTSAEISDIAISNATIRSDFIQDKDPGELNIGGVCGYACGESESTIKIARLQSDANISIENGMGSKNRVGGLFGTLHMKNHGDVNNCASYLTVEVNQEKCYTFENYIGAFGSIFSSNSLSVSDIFSKVTVNKIHDIVYTSPAYTARVITGFANFFPENSKGQFENVFGFVEQLDPSTAERVTSMELLNVYPGGICNETNCKGCEQLPEDHGFDETVWDLSNLSKPRLK